MPLIRGLDARLTYPSTEDPVTFCDVTIMPACADCRPAMALSKRAADLTLGVRCVYLNEDWVHKAGLLIALRH